MAGEKKIGREDKGIGTSNEEQMDSRLRGNDTRRRCISTHLTKNLLTESLDFVTFGSATKFCQQTQYLKICGG
jgi:hypothetical protein